MRLSGQKIACIKLEAMPDAIVSGCHCWCQPEGQCPTEPDRQDASFVRNGQGWAHWRHELRAQTKIAIGLMSGVRTAPMIALLRVIPRYKCLILDIYDALLAASVLRHIVLNKPLDSCRERHPLLPPLHRYPFPQHVHPEFHRLPSVQNCLHDVGRQQRQHQNPAEIPPI